MYHILLDFPTTNELNSGLQSGGAWAEFYAHAARVGIRKQDFRPIYCSYRGHDFNVYEKTENKKLLPGRTRFRELQIPTSLSFTDLDKKLKALPEGSAILCLAPFSFYYLTGFKSTFTHRSSWSIPNAYPHLRIMPSIHPDLCLRKYDWFSLLERDLFRLKEGYRPYPTTRTITIARDYSHAMSLLSSYKNTEEKSVDIETYKAHCSSIAIAKDGQNAIVIPFSRETGGVVDSYYKNKEEERAVREAVRGVLLEASSLVGQNFIFDLQFLFREYFFIPRVVRDTMLAAHVLSPSQKKDLATLCSLYLPDYRAWKEDKKLNKHEKEFTYAGSPSLWKYNGDDACNTFDLIFAIEEELKKKNRLKQAYEQYATIPNIMRMMMKGVKVDVFKRAELTTNLSTYITNAMDFIHKVVGYNINPESPKQLNDFFYSQLKLPVQLHPQRKNVTTDADALDTLGQIQPLVRPLTKAINFVRSSSGLLAQANMHLPPSNRAHCVYNPAGTDTFRLSSSENAYDEGSNLQNLTKGNDKPPKRFWDYTPNLRDMLIPDPGFYFYDGDLAKADVHFVAWEANDEVLKEWLKKKYDTHKMAAMEIFGVRDITKVTDNQRQLAKAGVHATNYGVFARKLATTLGITVKEAERFIKRWLEAHPGIKEWQDRISLQLQTTRTVRNVFGYAMEWLGRIDHHAIHAALAWGPQSSVAMYTRNIMQAVFADIAASNSQREIQVLLQTHDSLNWQVKKDRAEFWESRIPQLAAGIIAPYPDPLMIEFEVKRKQRSWGV